MRGEEVELGYLAHPEGGPHPGVVMIHDVWGLSEHTRDLARRLAGDGFAVLALDLYRRARPARIENPGAWMRALPDPEVLADVLASQRGETVTLAVEAFDRHLCEEAVTIRSDMRRESAALRSELMAAMKELRMDLRADFANTRADLLKWSFVFWIGQFAAVIGYISLMR